MQTCLLAYILRVISESSNARCSMFCVLERPIPTPEPNSRLCETPEMEDSVVESDAETSVMGDAEGEGEGPPAREVRQQPSHHIPPRTRAGMG